MSSNAKYDLCVIGGAGHVGLPLSVAFANSDVKTVIFDINSAAIDEVLGGKFPFKEELGEEKLASAIKKGTLYASTSPNVITQSDIVLSVTGTPIDEHLNPDFSGIAKTLEQYLPYFNDGQILVLRSTVYPGTSENIQNEFLKRGKNVSVAFCPERIAQGYALRELMEHPQIVSSFKPEVGDRVADLFKRITNKKIIRVKPIEAELAKLFTNTWRYIKFAAANQFYMLAEEKNVDYDAIHSAMTEEYPRNRDLPAPGFAAGPCLFKDTMQLAAFARNTFFLGHAAMLVNEGLPNFLIERLKQKHDLKTKTIGILGMAFKAESDDKRESLSYKLKKLAELECKEVLCHDVYIQDETITALEVVLKKSEILIIAAPHNHYSSIDPDIMKTKIVVDIWNVFN